MRKFIISLLLCLAFTTAKAQIPVSVGTPDTVRLSQNFPMLAETYPPKIYETWFKSLAECEKLALPPKEDLAKLRFFIVNSPYFMLNDTIMPRYLAYTFGSQRIILLTLPKVYEYEIVAHEFLHYLLHYHFGDKYEQEDSSHPDQYFSKCGVSPR